MKLWNTTAAILIVAFFISCDQKVEEKETTTNNLEETIRETNEIRYQAWNTGNPDLMEAQLSDDFVRYANGDIEFEGKSGYTNLMNMYLTGFPDLHFEYELVAVKNNKSFTKWTATGTNAGMFNGAPATGNQIMVHGFSVITYNDEGKIIKEEAYMDNLKAYTSIGYSLAPPNVD
ncbi:ester cyclase [Nonlabens marinus]|uniref:SnoaL-like domain-containing protein n=1 Tax=Nonlabens marinus S1-08 TaxID=1454201 RepID=W8VPA1_9FLAO|nr:ester cyclase [Nonlabens marinus]BAO54350.1 hypothetical protein NMS_0341 [Nonlabens marinus S1-08]